MRKPKKPRKLKFSREIDVYLKGPVHIDQRSEVRVEEFKKLKLINSSSPEIKERPNLLIKWSVYL